MLVLLPEHPVCLFRKRQTKHRLKTRPIKGSFPLNCRIFFGLWSLCCGQLFCLELSFRICWRLWCLLSVFIQLIWIHVEFKWLNLFKLVKYDHKFLPCYLLVNSINMPTFLFIVKPLEADAACYSINIISMIVTHIITIIKYNLFVDLSTDYLDCLPFDSRLKTAICIFIKKCSAPFR